MTKKTKLIIVIVACVVILAVTATLLGVFLPPLFREKSDETLLKKSDIAYLSEVRKSGNLVFEWVKPYNTFKPTLVVIPGESGGEDFSMTLDAAEYTFKESGSSSTDYVVADNIGYRAEGLKLNLADYWTNVAGWNVVIFRWENFTDEDNPDDILAKLFSVPKMRYSVENGYETTKVPNYSLTEVFATLYIEELSEQIKGNEIRFVGNGTGADLALTASYYLASKQEKGLLDKNVLPARVTLCDPYLSVDDMSLADSVIPWGSNISDDYGMLYVADKMSEKVASYGAAIEMVESKEIATVKVETGSGTIDQQVVNYAYDVEMGENDEVTFNSLKQKLTYLEFRESYSTKFSDEYKAKKRIAMDWYLYSIIGSDDSGNAGASYASGYPRSLNDFQTYYSYSGFNWAPNETRPIINNRQLNNDSSSTASSSRGKNFGLSAWTPTVYTRALRGISFSMKKYLTKTTKETVHGNPVYTFSDYTMAYFRSENFQLSDQDSYTLICGYVYKDYDGDGYMNDGYAGISEATLTVSVTDSKENEIASFSVNADDSGFYVVRLDDKTVDSEGDLSKEGYAFSSTHYVSLTFVPDSHDYYQTASAVSGVYYRTINGHNFTKYNTKITMNSYYADAITIANCLVKVSE